MQLTFQNGQKSFAKSAVENLVHIVGNGWINVSGTLVEGIGNYQSDLDVYVICDRLNTYGEIKHCGHSMFHNSDMMHCKHDDELVRRTLDYIPGDPTHLEIEYWTFEEAEALKTKIKGRFEYIASQADVTSQSPFSSGEEKLFHRCNVGMDLLTGTHFRERVFSAELREMYNFLTYRRYGSFFWDFKDVLGAIQSEEPYYILEMTRNYLIEQVTALYTIVGVTNPDKRWFPSYLQRLDPNEFGDVVKRALDLIYDVPTSAEGRKTYPFDVCPILDEVAELVRARLNTSSIMPCCSETLAQLAEEKLQRAAGNPNLAEERLFQEEFAFREGVLTGEAFTHRGFLERNLDWT